MSEVNSVGGRSGASRLSETSSQAAANEYLRKRHDHAPTQEEQDLLEQNKTLQEALFSSMYTLVKARTAESWKLAAVKMVLEALVPFLVVFNPTMGWPIATNNPVWQVVRWALPRSPLARIWGYDTYVLVFYAIVALIYTVLLAIAALTLAMKKQEHSKWLFRFARLLQRFTDLLFSVLYVAIFDYIIFFFSCKFGSPGNPHSYWEDLNCLSGSHLVVMAVAAVTAIVFFIATALLLIASCELNPVSTALMASPAAVTRVRVLVLKAAYVIIAGTLGSQSKIQAVLMVIPVCGITWFNFRTLPFLRFYINDLWTGGWMGVLYTVAVHVVWTLDGRVAKNPEISRDYTMLVLYGVFPAFLGGALLTTLWSRYRLRPAPKFADLPPGTKLKLVHQFGSPEDVEVVARAMRHFNSDGLVLEDKAALGEAIIKCGLAVFPGDVGLLVLLANFLMEVRRDGPAARTQLQLALKGGPSTIQRYQIFCTVENSKRLKDGQEGTLDLQSYVEFNRNYRAVIRVHKAALAAQREVWQLLLRPTVRTAMIEAALKTMEAAAETAHQVYRRVLNRYPSNGKLLRCYGKFLEDVRNDPIAATRAYAEAARNGGGDGLLSLDLQIQGADKPEFLTTMDMHEDACIVINSEGTILMVNSCVTGLLGYTKMDLEGANVSMIMPQPFSGRHAGYMSRYVQGGEPHILDTVRDVVALHKDRYVFPVRMCVTKLSGIGSDAIFLGLLRPEPLDTRNVRAWVAPNGVMLCADPQFASLTGVPSEDMVGRTFQSMVTDNAAVEGLLELCRESPFETITSGTIVRHIEMVNRYLPPVPVEVKVTPGGTDAQRILVINARRTDGSTEGLMVVDARGGLAFATWDVAAMLGYPLKKFLKMKLDQLLPQPFATMHAKHLRDQPAAMPPTSCRAGALVHLVNSNGANVPVRLKITSKDDAAGHTNHVIQMAKADASSATSMFGDKRLELTCSLDGTILAVDQPASNIFGFPAAAAVGSNLADCIDVFAEWRTKAGAHQLELLLLSLLDKEAEMPGTSWRVKVHSPEIKQENRLPNIDPKAAPRQMEGISACLQSEILDVTAAEAEALAAGAGLGLGGVGESSFVRRLEAGGDSGNGAVASRARIVLWRRNLLTGVVELDEHMVLRKADVATGLIVGLPPTALPRMPLSKLLDLPAAAMTWDELMNKKDEGGKSALKGGKSALKGSAGAAVVSAPRAFIGSHPDGGSMRIILQGVTGGAVGTGRITATLHPDTGFTGARANVYRALGLEAIIDQQQKDHHGPHHGAHQGQNQQQQQKQHGAGPGKAGAAAKHRTFSEAPAGGAEGGKGGTQPPAAEKKPGDQPPAPGAPAPAPAGELQRAMSRRVRAEVSLGARSSRLRFKVVADGDSPADGGSEAGEGGGGGGSLAAATVGARTELPEGSRSGLGSAQESESSYDSDGEDEEEAEMAERERKKAETKRRAKRARKRKAEAEQEKEEEAGDEEEDDDEEDEEEEDEDATGDVDHLHRNARTQADFIASWVRALSCHMSAARDLHEAAAAAAAAGEDGEGADMEPAGRAGGGKPGGGGRLRGGVAAEAVLSRANSRPLSRKGIVPDGDTLPGVDVLQHKHTLAAPRSRNLSRRLSRVPSRNAMRDAGGADVSSSGPEPSGRGQTSHQHHRSGGGGAAGAGGGGGEGGEDEDEADAEIERRLSRMESNKALAAKPEEREAAGVRQGSGLSGGNDGSSAGGDDDDATSAGGPSFSDASSALDVDLNVDVRRARLLKRMLKILWGPALAIPLARLRVRTVFLLLTMMISHVVCYVVLVGMINKQFGDVRAVHRLALAADRCQVAVTKAAITEFCSRPGIAPVSVCEVPLISTVADLRAALDDLEAYHQGTYLGVAAVPQRQDNTEMWNMWTLPSFGYQLYMDIDNSQWANLTAGVWQLGNRFLAAGRELLYWGPALDGDIRNLRAFHFLVDNGPWGLFRGYTSSLDHLAKQALDNIQTLQIGILVLLVVEAAVVQLACVSYQWWMVWRMELGRQGGMLAGLGLPGPILRILASKPLVVVEDSDDEDNDDEEGEGEKGGDGGDSGAVTAAAGGRRGSVDGSGVAAAGTAGASAGASAGSRDGKARGSRAAGAGASTDDDSDDEYNDRPRHSPGGKDALGVAGAPAGGSLASGGVSGGRSSVCGSSVGSAPVGGAGFINLAGKKGPVVQSVSGGVRVGGKVLQPSPNNFFKFMVPLVLWECALVVVLAVSYTQLERMQEPLVILNMASHVIYRYTRVRMIAFLLVAGRQAAERAVWREELRTEVANLQSEYDALMYGGVASTQHGTVFDSPVPASTFASSTFAGNFFKEERCFRWDQSKCYKPDSPYYEVTHHGLDVMMRRILSEMSLLVADNDVDATYNGTRYTTMYAVGIKDMYEGVQSSAELFRNYMMRRYDSIKLMHTILLVCTLVLLALYGWVVLRPYLVAVEVETGRLAGLLSHVPPELDVATHTRRVLRAHGKLIGTMGLSGSGSGTGGGRKVSTSGAGAGGEEEGRKLHAGLRKSLRSGSREGGLDGAGSPRGMGGKV